jgi:uncharacterized FlgJ-related protein
MSKKKQKNSNNVIQQNHKISEIPKIEKFHFQDVEIFIENYSQIITNNNYQITPEIQLIIQQNFSNNIPNIR